MGPPPAGERRAVELAVESMTIANHALKVIGDHEKECFELSKRNAEKLQLVSDSVSEVKDDIAKVNMAVTNLQSSLATRELKARDNTIKVMGTVMLLLFGIVGHLLTNGNPWQPKTPSAPATQAATR